MVFVTVKAPPARNPDMDSSNVVVAVGEEVAATLVATLLLAIQFELLDAKLVVVVVAIEGIDAVVVLLVTTAEEHADDDDVDDREAEAMMGNAPATCLRNLPRVIPRLLLESSLSSSTGPLGARNWHAVRPSSLDAVARCVVGDTKAVTALWKTTRAAVATKPQANLNLRIIVVPYLSACHPLAS